MDQNQFNEVNQYLMSIRQLYELDDFSRNIQFRDGIQLF
jgi:hypothetical protein